MKTVSWVGLVVVVCLSVAAGVARGDDKDTLKALSGKTHQVLTSVAVRHDDTTWQETQTSQVTFAPLTDAMIRTYCATSEPYDKAGGYAIQGMAAVFIQSITGSYSGIMGLPLHETAQLLHKAGIAVL